MKVQLNTLTEWNLKKSRFLSLIWLSAAHAVQKPKMSRTQSWIIFQPFYLLIYFFFCWIRNLIYFLKTLMFSNLEDFIFCLMSTPQPTVNWEHIRAALKGKSTMNTIGHYQVPHLTYNDDPWAFQPKTEVLLKYRLQHCIHYVINHAN